MCSQTKYIALAAVLMFCQLTFCKDEPDRFDYPVLSVKAGYHSGDYSQYVSPFDESFPHGFSIDGTIEIPTGKGWFVAINYDVSFASDNIYDPYNKTYVSRSFTDYNFTPLFIKYRVIIDNIAVYGGIGIGGSKMVVKYDKLWGSTSDGMIAFNSRIGVDYALKNGVMFSAEGVFQGMGEFDVGGGGRSNKMFQVKAGVGYLFNIPVPQKMR
jgi:hypothetical protein